jgi:hypothetical protein
MPSLLCPLSYYSESKYGKFKLDLVNDLVKEAIEALSAKERDGRILLEIL